MDSRQRLRVGVQLLLALALAVAGQLSWAKSPDQVADPLLLFGLAVLLLVGAARSATRPTRQQPSRPEPVVVAPEPVVVAEPVRRAKPPVYRIMLGALGVLFNIVALFLIRDRLQSYLPQVLIWITGWVLFTAAWLTGYPLRHASARLKTFWQANRNDILIVLGLFVVALILRLVRLDSVPYTVSGDEGSIGLDMRAALTGETRNPFYMGWGPQPTMFYFFQAALAWLFGDNVFVLRLPSAILGALTVPAVYLLGRELLGRRVGLVAAGLAVGYHFLLHYSRIGINSSWGAPTIAVALWLLMRGIRRNSAWPLAWSAIVLGLQFHLLYPGSARLAPIVGLTLIAWMFLVERETLRRVAVNLGMAVGLCVLVASPALQFAVRHPNEFNARFNQVGIFQSGWLKNETGIRNQSATAIIADQFKQSVMGLVALSDRSASYGASRPLLNPIMAIFFVFGLGYAMAKLTKTSYFLPACWFWGALVGGGVLTVNPPTSNRVTDIIAPLLILTAIGLVATADLARRVFRSHSSVLAATTACLVAVIGIWDVTYYFGEYQRLAVYGGGDAQVATSAGYYLRGQPAGTTAFFLGPPRMYFGFSTLSYLAPKVNGIDVTETLTDGELPLVSGVRTVTVALPGRSAELALIRDRYPGGSIVDVRRPGSNELLFSLYELPSGAGGR